MSSTASGFNRKILMGDAVGVITATNDEGGIHKVQIRPSLRELIDDVPVAQLYGFSGHAPVGSVAHMSCVTGERSKSVVVATTHAESRPRNLQSGEVAIYTDEGDIIILKRGHHIEIQTTGTVTVKAATKVRMETPRLEVTGDIIDHCDEQANTAKNMREIYNTHTHGGIQPGSGHTLHPDQPQREAGE